MVEALSVLAFPQQWDGHRIYLRLVCLPKGTTASVNAFKEADLQYEIHFIQGAGAPPQAAASVAARDLELLEAPVNKLAIFEELARQFRIEDREGLPAAPRAAFRKSSTDSYRQASGAPPLSPYLADEHDYFCARKNDGSSQVPQAPLSTTITWDERSPMRCGSRAWRWRWG